MGWQPENILGIIFGAAFVLLNGPLGAASLRWSRFVFKGMERRSAWPHRVGFILFGLLFIALGVVSD